MIGMLVESDQKTSYYGVVSKDCKESLLVSLKMYQLAS